MNKIHQEEETNFLYQGDHEIGAYKDNKLIQFRVLGLTRGLEIGASVALELKDKVYTPIHDAFGNIVTLVHHLQPVETYRYTAFGESLSLNLLNTLGDSQASGWMRSQGSIFLADAPINLTLAVGSFLTRQA